jgi:hypothetical protein
MIEQFAQCFLRVTFEIPERFIQIKKNMEVAFHIPCAKLRWIYAEE